MKIKTKQKANHLRQRMKQLYTEMKCDIIEWENDR